MKLGNLLLVLFFSAGALVLNAAAPKVVVVAEDQTGLAENADLELVESHARSGILDSGNCELIGRRHIEKILDRSGNAYKTLVNDKVMLGRLSGADILVVASIVKNTSQKRSQSITAYGMTERRVFTISEAEIALRIIAIGDEMETIQTTGYGSSQRTALANAKTNAVKQALGDAIDSYTLIQNEEVVQDDITSISNGFIKNFEITSSPKQTSDGLYEVEISANVPTGKGRILDQRVFRHRVKTPLALSECAMKMRDTIGRINLAQEVRPRSMPVHQVVVDAVRNGVNIPGLDVFINGQFVGNTPYRESLEDGTYLIAISQSGRTLWENRVPLRKPITIRPEVQ